MKKSFRDDFKYYKRKNVPLDHDKVINFNLIKESSNIYKESVRLLNNQHFNQKYEKIFGLLHPSEWEVYEFLNKPGLIFIKNPFLGIAQRYWIVRCLKYFTKKPSKLNIDAHHFIKSEEDWWEFCQSKIDSEEGKAVLQKLRWVTFGYHHNWDTKVYEEHSKCDFPIDLKILCSYIAEVLNFSNFNAEAAIINMYHFGSTLSGHTDHSEVNLTAPLFSFSFGQSAIFLIGGKTIDEEAIPLLLQSGDIIIMSKESRLCYHGVPKILSAKEQPWDTIEDTVTENNKKEFFLEDIIDNLSNERFWDPFKFYVSKSRINMNVRQVLLLGQNSLCS